MPDVSAQPTCLLGIDCGNTVIKAALFTTEGRELAVHAESVDTLRPAPGFAETDMRMHWQQCSSAIRAVLAESGIDPASIVGIGTSGHGNGLYTLDREGKPLKAIQSMDTRAEQQLATGDLDHTAILALNHQGIWAAQTPVLLRWLKTFEPATYQQIGTAFLCKDYVGYCLTGERGSDFTDMSGCGMLDFEQGSYSSRLLSCFDLADAEASLPPLRHSTDVLGRVTEAVAELTGLKAGTPVVAGLFDVVASALGSGVERTGQASIIAGTWSCNQAVVETLPAPGSIFMPSQFDQTRFLAIESSATSTANLEWFIREFCAAEMHQAQAKGCSVYDVISEQLKRIELPSDQPLFHPYLYGAGQAAQARAGFYGITGWHDRSSLLYALFEGVVFGHRQHIERLMAAGVPFHSATLTGGGARSRYWTQLFADILGIEIHTAAGSETGALGAAIAAGTGSGVFASYAEGCAAMTERLDSFSPRPELTTYFDQRYQWFVELWQTLDPVWRRMARG
jgi:L-xylulokinase